MNNHNKKQEEYLLKIVDSVYQKSEKQLKKYEEIKNENTFLCSCIKEKEEKIREYENKLKNLKQKNELLKTSNELKKGDNDKGIAKQKIAEMIKEIDACIKLLNNLE